MQLVNQPPPPNDQVQPYAQPSPYAASPYGAPPGMWGAPGAGGVDFRAAASCGTRSMVWGVIGIVVGALFSLSGLLATMGGSMMAMGGAAGDVPPTAVGLVALAMGVCSIVVGIFYVRAAGALKAAAQNGDATLVNQGLRSMGNALLTQIIVFFVGAAVYLIFVLAVMSAFMKHKGGF